jgi:para-aminobenzoate synthetase component 1
MKLSLFNIEIPYRDPLTAFAPFANEKFSAFLDSPNGNGRYAYIAPSPVEIISADQLTAEGTTDPTADNGWSALQALLATISADTVDTLPPFQTGIIGYFGYELGRHLERLPPPREAGIGLPEIFCGVYDVIAAFDTVSKRAWVISNGYPHSDIVSRRENTERRAQWLAKKIATGPDISVEPAISPATSKVRWRPEMSRSEYEEKVERTIEYIRAGDIFQANLTQRFLCARPEGLHPFDLYRRLRAESPAPYAAYLSCGENRSLLSASPERFLTLTASGDVTTQPIKGSRPRGETKADDLKLAQALCNSPKDKAENLMIVDLVRNDLSRVCETGTVRVPELCKLESFANMHHLVSTVTGKLKKKESALSLLKACFPGGSVTGAPKIRAMEIIHELEPARRGPYCGAIGWIGFNGAMETNIVIRTLLVDGQEVIAQAGGAIVADSKAAQEYDESLSKVRALLRCLDPEGQSAV